jgi:hypothetical protein
MKKLQYKSIQNLKTLEGYIFYILQHFATKLCNFTNFMGGALKILLVLRGGQRKILELILISRVSPQSPPVQ